MGEWRCDGLFKFNHLTDITPTQYHNLARSLHNVVSTKFHYFKIVLPTSPYIIIPPGGIIIYEIAEGNILKKCNVVDPT